MPTSTPLPTRLPTRARGGVTTIASSMERLFLVSRPTDPSCFRPAAAARARPPRPAGWARFFDPSPSRRCSVPAAPDFVFTTSAEQFTPIGCVTQPTEWKESGNGRVQACCNGAGRTA